MNKDEDMSNTFVSEVGQKSAIFRGHDDFEVEDEVTSEDNTDLEKLPEESNEVKEDKEIKEEDKEVTREINLDPDPIVEEKPKKEKKRHPFITFLLMLLCLALGAGGSYYYFEVMSTDNNKPKEKKKVAKEEKEEELSSTSRFVINMIDKYSLPDSSFDSYLQLYTKDNTLLSDFDTEYVQKLGAINTNKVIGFTEEELQNSLDQLFGSKKVTAEKDDIESIGCYKYSYENEEYSIEKGDSCTKKSDYIVKTKIIKAIKNNNSNDIEITIAVALSDGNKVYKGYNTETNKVKDEIVGSTYETLDMDSDYKKFNMYKYTFNYDSLNNDYYFNSIKLVK